MASGRQSPPSGSRLGVGFVTLCGVFFAATVASTVLGKKGNVAVPVFPLALSALTALAGVAVYPLLFLGILLADSRVDLPARFLHRRGMLSLPSYALPATVGALFAAHNVLANLGARGNVVPGPLVAILSKLVVPFSMSMEACAKALGYHHLYSRISVARLLAVVLLFAGVALSVFGPEGKSFAAASGASTAAYVTQVAFLVTADIPLALGILVVRQFYKAAADAAVPSGHGVTHELVFWWWVSLFELPWVIVLAPLSAYLQDFPMASLGRNARDGLACWVGGVDPSLASLDSYAKSTASVDCGYGSKMFYASLVAGFAFNVCMPLLAVRASTTTLLWILRAAALPFAVLAFSLHIVMGTHATPLHPWGLVGLALVLVALLVFTYSPRQPAASDSTVEVGDAEAVASVALLGDRSVQRFE
ncbi:uncharacterized protein AMSG_03234 [Thecamonas trahens ATCC 50062]|uniref:Uncharacterized protein n=1 Tax=Thecamonas trahens ATCC 50062 TaxID=461836 RepID=A0A0L0D662_THETB|nr:hypothetical protein AMSG_03234 [Thecamonas trahens ATCC 50062]KNC46803.1 hypothetical protein AMSG_03234 [Thecamonas trahens ATCC 50062]|eukprot:XP_013760078.1 hypothetical protein AMSG_03234 [Thecamonas trahens ATCC 50062]